ncbi:hypothetical protein NA57DRAFT_57924 [Rhizodiscina lignyota]|uniref:HIG1 domain-containing protein n=1 Tax=Rhizodiscina lignyota TaxID=1504668 RepID=A0A9P4M7G9_9PEZI|nr:hypothetical protein NA57DRAFT_57924 [Rhizodiscina lignyota]
MKIISKEEEAQHYNATVKGGLLGGALGIGLGTAGVWLASKRYPAFRSLTIQFRAFLGCSVGTFAAIIAADRASRKFQVDMHPEEWRYIDKQETLQEQIEAAKPAWERTKDYISTNRYPIIFASWVASMGIALGLVGRNPYLTGAQKLVQARVYAQGLTVAVLVSSFALEARDANKGQGRWETVKVLDPNDPTHKHLIEKRIHHERYSGEDQWMDMVAAEEERMKERQAEKAAHEKVAKKEAKAA